MRVRTNGGGVVALVSITQTQRSNQTKSQIMSTCCDLVFLPSILSGTGLLRARLILDRGDSCTSFSASNASSKLVLKTFAWMRVSRASLGSSGSSLLS